MSDTHKISNQLPGHQPSGKATQGFSLIELMVAMAIFLVVGGTVIALVRKHVPLFNTAQNQAGLNVSLRNAVAQLQMEVVNAGSSYSATSPMPFWPIGATIQPATTPGCAATRNYVSTCFDQFSLIDADPALPALAPGDQTGTVSIDTSATSTIFLTAPGNPANASSAQYTNWAALLPAGTPIMLVQGGTDMPAGQPRITVTVVQAPGASQTGNSIQVPIARTSVGGAPTADPMGLYDAGEAARFTSTFNPQLDYAIKLNATKYSVDGTDITNPKLVRINPTGAQDVIAEQIVGFTVSAWSSLTQAYTNVPANYNSDWASIRSLNIQLIARTVPNTDQSLTNFQNTFDQGPYQVQGVSVVINPRNLNTN